MLEQHGSGTADEFVIAPRPGCDILQVMVTNTKTTFDLETLEVTPSLTRAEVDAAYRVGRFAEMTPHVAGFAAGEDQPPQLDEE